VLALDAEMRKVKLGAGLCSDERLLTILEALIAWDL
jgi:hypothetical protein